MKGRSPPSEKYGVTSKHRNYYWSHCQTGERVISSISFHVQISCLTVFLLTRLVLSWGFCHVQHYVCFHDESTFVIPFFNPTIEIVTIKLMFITSKEVKPVIKEYRHLIILIFVYINCKNINDISKTKILKKLGFQWCPTHTTEYGH